MCLLFVKTKIHFHEIFCEITEVNIFATTLVIIKSWSTYSVHQLHLFLPFIGLMYI